MSVMLDIQILGRDGSRVNDTRVLAQRHQYVVFVVAKQPWAALALKFQLTVALTRVERTCRASTIK